MITKGELIKLMTLRDGCEVDCARPLEFDNQCRMIGVNPHDFVWFYDKQSTTQYFGRPMSLSDIFFEIAKNHPEKTLGELLG